MVTNCFGKRLFSKLKRIKSVLRLAMSQERLCDLSILCVEMLNCDLLILMTPLTNSQPGKLEGRYFGNKLPTCRNYTLAYHKYVKRLNRLT